MFDKEKLRERLRKYKVPILCGLIVGLFGVAILFKLQQIELAKSYAVLLEYTLNLSDKCLLIP